MAVARETVKQAVAHDGLSFLEVDWDYDDVNMAAVRLHGVRVVNLTPDLVFKLWVYGNDKGTQRNLLFEQEYQPGTDTGMQALPSPLNVRSGGFNFAYQPLRYAP